MSNTAAPPAKSRAIPLLLAAAVLGGLLYWDKLGGGSGDDVARPVRSSDRPVIPAAPGPTFATQQKAADPSLGINPLAELKLTDLDATMKRPLFEATRRPIEPPRIKPPAPPPRTVVAPPAPAPIPAFKLFGILASGGSAMAIIGHPGAPAPLRLETGDHIEGWRVDTIEPNRVVLSRGAQRKELTIFRRPS